MHLVNAINHNSNYFCNELPMAKCCATQGCYSNTLNLTELDMKIEKNEDSIIC